MEFFQKYEINPNGVVCVLLSFIACYCIYMLFDGFLIKPPVIDYIYLFLASIFTIFLIFLYKTEGYKEAYISYSIALLCILIAVGANELAGYYYANLFEFSIRGDYAWLFISVIIVFQYIILHLLYSLAKIYNIAISLLLVMVAVLIAEPMLIKAVGIALTAFSFIFFMLGSIVLLSIIFKSRG